MILQMLGIPEEIGERIENLLRHAPKNEKDDIKSFIRAVGRAEIALSKGKEVTPFRFDDDKPRQKEFVKAYAKFLGKGGQALYDLEFGSEATEKVVGMINVANIPPKCRKSVGRRLDRRTAKLQGCHRRPRP